MTSPRLPALFVLLIAPVACEDGPRRPSEPPRRAPERPPLAFRHPDESPRPSEETFLPDGGLRTVPELVARCVSRNQRGLTPELSAALGVLDPAALLEDACRLDLAPRLRSPELCADVASSALRETCTARAAIAIGAPDRCPRTPGLIGRDPVCVAVAARDPGLCTAAPGSEVGRCLALVRADPRGCDGLDTLFRSACSRDLAALSPWLSRRSGAPRGEAVVTLRRLDPSDAGSAASWTLRAHRRGAWLDEAGVLHLLDPALTLAHGAVVAADDPVVVARVPTAGLDAGATVMAEARVMLLDGMTLDTADQSARATARWRVVPRGRGAAASLELRVEGSRAGRGEALVLTVEGFVRDVVPAAMLR